MKKILCLIIIFISSSAAARDRIRAVGSSTLYPFIAVVAERFSKNYDFKAPIVESTGTGGGINLICSGNDIKYPDIVSASRKIKDKELARCKANGVNNLSEILLGYDGITIISSKNSENYAFTIQDLFLAMAEFIPGNGKIVKNNNITWNQINKNLPKNKIVIYGPSFTSGTREALIDLAIIKHCMTIPEFISEYTNPAERHLACKLIRRDGAYIDMGNNENLIIQKVASNNSATGIIGYNFLLENKAKIKAASIENILPEYNTIIAKTYPLSRELYLYVNDDHKKLVPGINEYVAQFSSSSAVSKYGYLTLKGFIPEIRG